MSILDVRWIEHAILWRVHLEPNTGSFISSMSASQQLSLRHLWDFLVEFETCLADAEQVSKLHSPTFVTCDLWVKLRQRVPALSLDWIREVSITQELNVGVQEVVPITTQYQ